MERFGINAAFNAGAIKFNDKYLMVVRVEGADRKSFFAVAESPRWYQPFHLLGKSRSPCRKQMSPTLNVYDMRLTAHDDGYIYGLFCTERRDPGANARSIYGHSGLRHRPYQRPANTGSALPDLKTNSLQQRNVVLHPEFVDGKYALYTRPQDGFISAGTGEVLALGLRTAWKTLWWMRKPLSTISNYHTVYEAKNGQGPTPIKTDKGWLHLAHGVRNTAAGLRLRAVHVHDGFGGFTKVLYKPAGYFLAPEGEERIGDVSKCSVL
jgi:4-O-beta-D-mannosyl-D-glucose phosphorylase